MNFTSSNTSCVDEILRERSTPGTSSNKDALGKFRRVLPAGEFFVFLTGFSSGFEVEIVVTFFWIISVFS